MKEVETIITVEMTAIGEIPDDGAAALAEEGWRENYRNIISRMLDDVFTSTNSNGYISPPKVQVFIRDKESEAAEATLAEKEEVTTMTPKPEITTLADEAKRYCDPDNSETAKPSDQRGVTDLIADIFTALELGWDIENVRKTEKTRATLSGVSATFDELVEIARYVESTYCEDCPLRYV